MASIKQVCLLLSLLMTPWLAAAEEPVGAADIPLLANRFRIDHGVKEVTFIIKRIEGGGPVILVRPDGSKLYSHRHPAGDVGWLQTKDAELITVRDPMPGPWQAIGNIDPDNRVRLLSDIELQYDPLPMRVFQSEILKVTSRVIIDGAQATDKDYVSDLGMTLRLQSLPHTEGAEQEDIQVGHYLDNGQDLDERPHDGVLTARVVLEADPGKYRAIISTGNEVFVRARSQEIFIYPQPFQYSLNPPTEKEGPKLSLLVDREELDPGSLAVTGQVLDPSGVATPFNGSGTEQNLSLTLAKPEMVGLYQVQATLLATTKGGREVQLQLPQREFSISPKPVIEPAVSQAASAAEATEHANEEGTSLWVWIAAGVGVLLLLLAAVGFILMQKRKALKKALAARQAAEEQASAKAPASEVDLNQPEQ